MNSPSLTKHSVRIAGHATSVSLESAFWEALCEIAARRRLSVNALLSQIDAERGGNLSSANAWSAISTASVSNSAPGTGGSGRFHAKRQAIGATRRLVEAHEDHTLRHLAGGEMGPHRRHRDPRRLVAGKAIDAGRDRR